ncbi:MAG: tRNA pseudouridine(38-40) synthase TruA [Rhodocyclaceae bacterium]|nr:tRNA pseudouridine(38-40) synthase TruA [Rhodocyclaceae bacterium]
MIRIVLSIEYNGAAFTGWQSQPHGNTVQDVLEAALAVIADAPPVRVACAGRTDTGVHATSQIVHFDTEANRPLNAWVRGVNSHLPQTVAVRWAHPVTTDFHARFSARSRSYRYLLLNRTSRPALLSGRVGWFHAPLDENAMRTAANHLLGEHDFSAFRAAECQAKSPVKTLYRADISRERDLIVFDFRANAFLHHMVRNLVGALVFVGKGRYPPEWMLELLAACNRSQSAPTFDAAGLYFTEVEYSPEWNLPAQSIILP